MKTLRSPLMDEPWDDGRKTTSHHLNVLYSPFSTWTPMIILNASTTSIKGSPAFSIYSSIKAAVRNLARSWAMDLKGRGIRVNVVSPGMVPTPGYDGLGLSKEQKQGFIDAGIAAIPLGRVGTTDEVARAVVFLASEDSSFVNAVELFVNGGMTQV